MNKCKKCGIITSNPSFCSKSCSAKYNNKGVRRHGNPPNDCLYCGQKTKSCKQIYCSKSCYGKAIKKYHTKEDILKAQRSHFMKYYMSKRKQTPTDANMEEIKRIYLNCPKGYEVDHIIPVSRGGLHHENNLQYLTVTENRKKSNKLNHK